MNKYQQKKNKIFQTLEIETFQTTGSKLFVGFIVLLIILNVLAVIIGSIESIYAKHEKLFDIFEIISVIVFSLEYLLRVWTCTEDQRYKNPVFGRIKYIFTPLALVDLIAILPFYIPLFIVLDMRFIRALRLFRLFRLFKISRHSNSFLMVLRVFNDKKDEIFLTVVTVLVILMIFSAMMYFVEKEAQPDAFPSILAAMWWGIAKLAGIDIGGITPITIYGKIIEIFMVLLGIGGIFALPTAILSSGFSEQVKNEKCKKAEKNG